MATAEFAIVLPAIALALLLVLSAIATGAAHLRATDAAQAAARAAAAGEGLDVATGHAMRLAPDGATVTVSREGDLVVAVVEAPFPGALSVTGYRVSGRASAATEESYAREVPP